MFVGFFQVQQKYCHSLHSVKNQAYHKYQVEIETHKKNALYDNKTGDF